MSDPGAPAEHDLIAMFLGARAAEEWSPAQPWTLLGFRLPIRDSAVVMSAMRERLALLNAHPLARSPEGDHVRRLISAAASGTLLVGADTPQRLPTIDATGGIPAAQPTPSTPTRAAALPQPALATIGYALTSPPPPPSPPALPLPMRPTPAQATAPAPQATFADTSEITLLTHIRLELAQHSGLTPAAVQALLPILIAAGRSPAELTDLVHLAMTAPAFAAVPRPRSTSKAHAQPAPAAAAPSPPTTSTTIALDPPIASAAPPAIPIPAFNVSQVWPPPSASPDWSAVPSSIPRDSSTHDLTSSLLIKASLLGAAALIAVAGATVGIILIFRAPHSSTSPGAATAATATTAPSTDAATAAPADAVPETPAGAGDIAPRSTLSASDLIRTLAAAGVKFDESPDEALAAARPALQTILTSWDAMTGGDRTALGEAVVDLVYKAGPRSADIIAQLQSAAPALDSAAALAPQQVRPAAMAAALLWRLTREHELPAPTLTLIDAAARAQLGTDRPAGSVGVAAGLAASLRALPARIVLATASASSSPLPLERQPSPRAPLQAWRDAVAAMERADPALAAEVESIKADALERVLERAGDPAVSRAPYEATTLIAGALKWDAGAPARTRLLAWLGDERFTASQLSLVTASMVRLARAENTDDTMILAGNAAPEQRAALRESLATAWRLSATLSAGASSALWSDFARTALTTPDEPDHIALLLQAAKFNEAVALRVQGKGEEAAALILSSPPPVLSAGAGPLILASGGTGPAVAALVSRAGDDESWAARYLAGDRSVAVRMQRIADLDAQAPTISQLDADILAEVAVIGSPPELAAAAQKAVVKFGPSPMMTHAVLKILPRAPRRDSIGRMVDQLTLRTVPPTFSDQFFPGLRRALVERLLEQVAVETFAGRVDQACQRLAVSYDTISGNSTAIGLPDADKAAELLRVSAAHWRDTLRAQATRLGPTQRLTLTLEQSDRALAARRLVARGPLQAFACDQLACFELLTLAAAAERPEAVPRLNQLVLQVTADRRTAADILAQLRIVEQAITRIWVERLALQGVTP